MVEEHIMYQQLQKICREKVCRINVFWASVWKFGQNILYTLNNGLLLHLCWTVNIFCYNISFWNFENKSTPHLKCWVLVEIKSSIDLSKTIFHNHSGGRVLRVKSSAHIQIFLRCAQDVDVNPFSSSDNVIVQMVAQPQFNGVFILHFVELFLKK